MNTPTVISKYHSLLSRNILEWNHLAKQCAQIFDPNGQNKTKTVFTFQYVSVF